MRFISVFTIVLILLAAASAAELKVKVLDPQSAAVFGAQVELLQQSSRPALVGLETTSAEGLATFHRIPAASYRLRVMAPGFAQQTLDVSTTDPAPITVPLRLYPGSETVVVTATRIPVSSETTNAQVETISAAQLQTMNPVASDDVLRFLPGAVLGTQGQRGGLASLFVRGGDSRYNKVIVDGVPVNDPGGTFDFGTLPLPEVERLEFVRGAQSTLYGSDAMSSVVQLWSRTGSTTVPELRFGADGGNLGAANGYAALSGAFHRFDYNMFADQFNTEGQGLNDDYSDALQGGNVGFALTHNASIRLRVRHSNSRTGVQGEWNFNRDPLMPPDSDQFARDKNLLASAELNIAGPSRWRHRITGFEFNLKRTNVDQVMEAGRVSPLGNIDFPFEAISKINRAGFDYQGDYAERSWAHTTLGYEFEDENGVTGNLPASLSHGLRRNYAVYAQQFVVFGRVSLVAGGRFVHNESFGNKAVPRVALGITVLRGGQFFAGTRLLFSYATGIKEPTFPESFGNGGGFPVLPNPLLKPERARAFEAGLEQKFSSTYSLSATYFNNLFRDKIDFNSLTGALCGPIGFCGQYVNVNEALAHGAEVVFHAQPLSRISIVTSYTYTSTQVLQAPFCTLQNFCDPLLARGQPLIRRPKHLGSTLLTYAGKRWGGTLGGVFVDRRADSDFLGFGIDHAAGFARVDLGGWYALNSRIRAYVHVQNALDRQYQEVVGYPALGINFRAGMRFRIGGE